MIRFGNEYPELAGIQYFGLAGISASCAKAVQRLIASDEKVARALLLSAEGYHAFLLNLGDEECEEWVAIKTGFSSGYAGEGPRTLSETLALLEAFDVFVEEVAVQPALLQRLDRSALTSKDLEFATHANPVRPRRWADYMYEVDFGYANRSRAIGRLQAAMPWGVLDKRLYDLAKSFESNPDHALMAGFRRLEEAIRARLGDKQKEALDSKVFSIAFMGDAPMLEWKDLPKSERIARGNLFIGAYGAFRNPRAHRERDEDSRVQLSEFLTLNMLFQLESEAIPYEAPEEDGA